MGDAKKGDVIFAGKATPGQVYLWIKADKTAGARTLVDKILPDGKAVIRFFVPGYGFKTNAHTVPAGQCLKVIEQEEGKKPMPKKAEKSAKPAKQENPKKEAAPAKEKKAREPKAEKIELARLPKMIPGKGTPTEVIDGVKYRAGYRARSNAQRVADCEAAKGDMCNCRCKGALHGKTHGKFLEAENALFIDAAEKKQCSYVTAKEMHALVKKFGGPVKHEPKPRGRKPGSKAKAKK
jgi:hypothetical protein